MFRKTPSKLLGGKLIQDMDVSWFSCTGAVPGASEFVLAGLEKVVGGHSGGREGAQTCFTLGPLGLRYGWSSYLWCQE